MRGPGGSVIPHARAIGALMIPMIETTFRTPAVAGSRRADGAPARGDATARRAVRVAAVTRDTDREDPVTAPAGFLAKGCVHGVGAARVRSNWTYSPNRGTTDRTASARRSPRQSRGSGVSVRALTLSLPSLRHHPPSDQRRRGRGRYGKPHSTRFPTPPTARVFPGRRNQNAEPRRTRRGEHRPDFRALT